MKTKGLPHSYWRFMFNRIDHDGTDRVVYSQKAPDVEPMFVYDFWGGGCLLRMATINIHTLKVSTAGYALSQCWADLSVVGSPFIQRVSKLRKFEGHCCLALTFGGDLWSGQCWDVQNSTRSLFSVARRRAEMPPLFIDYNTLCK